LLQAEAVALGNDHQMPVGIRVFIHNHKYSLTLIEDEVLLALFLFQLSAKDTPSLFLP
jgi:hypothetical protein